MCNTCYGFKYLVITEPFPQQSTVFHKVLQLIVTVRKYVATSAIFYWNRILKIHFSSFLRGKKKKKKTWGLIKGKKNLCFQKLMKAPVTFKYVLLSQLEPEYREEDVKWSGGLGVCHCLFPAVKWVKIKQKPHIRNPSSQLEWKEQKALCFAPGCHSVLAR